jgi:hypothetical protein
VTPTTLEGKMGRRGTDARATRRLEETEDSVILKVEKNDTLGNRGQVTIWKTSLRPLSILEEV